MSSERRQSNFDNNSNDLLPHNRRPRAGAADLILCCDYGVRGLTMHLPLGSSYETSYLPSFDTQLHGCRIPVYTRAYLVGRRGRVELTGPYPSQFSSRGLQKIISLGRILHDPTGSARANPHSGVILVIPYDRRTTSVDNMSGSPSIDVFPVPVSVSKYAQNYVTPPSTGVHAVRIVTPSCHVNQSEIWRARFRSPGTVRKD
ncbi:hypothetical protein FHL15_010929 [Xylaria flabelliformis]|uniref:Uncharacterized protein n=1 Tax=Xylaria flabelliformis TaxID=2512241 RepID=A0A553HJQ0_9PEZI|nr:hypothetical protein FHL15_010929 [Xylaria flabelliformis]